MLRLMKLEMRKHRMGRYIIGAVVAVLGILIFLTVSMVDSATDPTQTKDTYESAFMMVNLLLTLVFLVYASVLTATLVIGEYNNKTIFQLFCYPVSRQRLIGAKLLIVVTFTAAAMIFGTLCCTLYLVGVDQLYDLLAGSLDAAAMYQFLAEALTSILMASVLSLLPFVVGMLKKSVPLTIVSALFVMMFRQLLITKNVQYRETLPQMAVVILLTLAVVALTMRKKINDLDNL